MPIVAVSSLNRSSNSTPAPASRPIDRRLDIQPRARVRRPVEPVALDVEPSARVRRRIRPVAAAVVTPPQVVAAQPDPEPSPKHDYDVGHGKPPKHTQFQKGVSGNPKGRPRGAKGLKTMVRKILTEKVVVKTGRGPKRMARMEAMLHKITEKAFGGDLRALQSLIQLYQASVPDEPLRMPALDMPVVDQDSHDIAILAALRQSFVDENDEE